MIIEALLNIIMTLLQVVFGWINIPGFPVELTNSINSFINLIFDNLTLLVSLLDHLLLQLEYLF